MPHSDPRLDLVKLTQTEKQDAVVPCSFREAARFWLWLGCVSFGGPAAQIALMHTELVEKRRWVDREAFATGLAFCTVLPGPEAQQLATWLGLRLHGVRGGLFAGLCFFLPASLLLWLLSYLYFAFGAASDAAYLVLGLKCAVLVLLAHALWRFSRQSLTRALDWLLAVGCFATLSLGVSFAAYLILVGLIGALRGVSTQSAVPVAPARFSPGAWRAGVVLAVFFGFCLIVPKLGVLSEFADMAYLLTQAVLMTFGGAYAVLPLVFERAQSAGWLDARSAMAGLALAESTPGPLLLVLGFIGFAFGWQLVGAYSPLWGATLGFIIAIFCTFTPSFVLVFCGAASANRINQWPRALAAAHAISRSIIGAIAWLALAFALALIFPGGRHAQLDGIAVLVCGVLALLQWRLQLSSAYLVASGLLLGLGLTLFMRLL